MFSICCIYLIVLLVLDSNLFTFGGLDLSSDEAFLLAWYPTGLLTIERLGLLFHQLLTVDS